MVDVGYVVRWTDESRDEGESEDRARDVATAVSVFRQVAEHEDARIIAVAPDGTETPLPTYEGALVKATRADAVLVSLERMIEGLAKRPGMYGSPCCVEAQAWQAMGLRRELLGVAPDAHPGPGPARGVHDGLRKERFGEVNTPAYCHLRDADDLTSGEQS